jgi:hypothetical protein
MERIGNALAELSLIDLSGRTLAGISFLTVRTAAIVHPIPASRQCEGIFIGIAPTVQDSEPAQPKLHHSRLALHACVSTPPPMQR